MTVEAAAYSAENGNPLQCLLSHKRAFAENINDSDVIDYSSAKGDERPVQPGRAYSFNGVDGIVELPFAPPASGEIKFDFYFSTASTVTEQNIFQFTVGGIGFSCGLNFVINNRVAIQYYNPDGTHFRGAYKDGIVADTVYRMQAIFNFTTRTFTSLTIDGVSGVLGGGQVARHDATSTTSVFGRRGTSSFQFTGVLYDFILIQDDIKIAHYKMDEGAGTAAYDSSGNGNHGTLVGGVTHYSVVPATGDGADYQNQIGYGEALYFPTGSTEQYSLGAANLFQSGKISFNIKTTDSTFILFSSNTSSNPYSYVFCVNQGDSSAGISYNIGSPIISIDGSIFSGNRDDLYNFISDGEWHSVEISNISSNDTDTLNINGYTASFSFSGELRNIEVDYTNDGTTDLIFNDYHLIPRDESTPTLDVLGNPLQYTGRVPYNGALVNSNALSLNGVNQYISLGTDKLSKTNNFTITAIIKTTALNQRIFGRRNATNTEAEFYIESGTLRFFSGTIYNSATLVNTGNFVHVAVAINSSSSKMYVDGLPVITFSPAITQRIGIDTRIGASEIGSFFNGSILDFRWYDSALSDADILAVKNNTYSSTTPIAHYPISEGSGSTIYDVSGNGNHGTAVNSPSWTTQDVFYWNITNGYSEGVNYVTSSEDLTNSAWTTPDNNAVIIDATTVQWNSVGVLRQILASLDPTGKTYTVSFKARHISGTNAGLKIDVSNSAGQSVVVTSELQSYSLTFDTYTTTTDLLIDFQTNTTPSSSVYEIKEIQVQGGLTATPYQPTTGSSNIGAKVPATENGYIPNGGTDPVSNPAVNGHNGAETQINLNPAGAPELVSNGVPLNTLYHPDSLPSGYSHDTNTDGARNIRKA